MGSSSPEAISQTSSSVSGERSGASRNRTEEKTLERYATEFAALVDRHTPSRTEAPSEWVARLPNEVFHYYAAGIASFGRRTRSGTERRGRLYLLHTALVLMWIEWGKRTAHKRFRRSPRKGVQRAASLVTLEHYRRAEVLADLHVSDWCGQPVEEWTVTVRSRAVSVDEEDAFGLRTAVEEQDQIDVTVETFSALRASGVVPRRKALVLE